MYLNELPTCCGLSIKSFTKYSPISRRQLPPSNPGIYICVDHNLEILYVGSATGKKGLRGRICGQHLNRKYVESRQERWSYLDSYQAGNPLLIAGKLAIDKSTLRKKVGRKYRLYVHETTDFLIKNFFFYWCELISFNREKVLSIEKELILVTRPSLNN